MRRSEKKNSHTFVWNRYLGLLHATSAPESFILMKNVTADHSFMCRPAEEHLRCLKTRFRLDIAGPCCDCESVHSVPGKIMARHRTSLKCSLGRTGPATDCLWHHMCSCLSGKVFSRMHTWSQAQLWISESSVKHFLQHGSKQNVILYWTPQCITHAHSKQQLTTDAPCWLSTEVCTVERGEKSGLSSWKHWLLDA